MKLGSFSSFCTNAFIVLLIIPWVACGGGSGGNGGGGGGGGNPPAAPSGLTATAGNQQISLTWNASSGATSYNVYRGTTAGGESTTPLTTGVSAASYTDTGLTNGTKYYYVVAAVNSYGTSGKSPEASAAPAAPTTAVNVTIDAQTNRHSISSFVYGGNFPKDPATATAGGLTVVRWGGNAATPYNWTNFDTNASADWYFQNRPWDSSANPPWPVDSVQWVAAVQNANSAPIMTIGMLPWVAKDGLFNSISFSISKYGYTACHVNPYYSDDGDGTKAPCGGATTNYVTGNDPHDAYVPLLDGPPQAGDPAGSIYRNQWVAKLGAAFASGRSCVVPYSSINSCHFYDMDNEIDIWSGTHRDIHPSGAGYNELRDTFVSESRAVKSWDSQAVRLGPVSCCWWFYWNLPSATDNKSAHANIDFLPWWLNEVYWRDQIANTRSLDLFDIHAYPDATTSGLTPSQLRALANQIYREYWDPTYVSPSWINNNTGVTSIEPVPYNPFRIPRMRAIVNSTYPGTPLAFTEWSADFASPSGASDSDFSTALGDADAYGILGRERVGLASRWLAPDPANPNYQALKLYTNYDGSHHTFNPISVSATHNADPNLFSVYAATNPSGNSMTVMVLNKDPNNAAQTTFTFKGFNASSVTTYTLSQSTPNTIVAASPGWSSTMTFQPYTATLLVISGSSTPPASEWDLNPDTTMVAAGGSVTLAPKLISGSTTVTLSNATFDNYEGASQCGGNTSIGNGTIASGSPGAITLTAPASAGFCHFSVTASDGTTQGGWLVVGNPPAALSKTTDPGSGTHGTTITLAATLAPGQSGGTAVGASVFFSTDAGSLQNVAVGSETVFTGSKVIAVTDSNGLATVKLTLPGSTGSVHVTSEGPFALGHPVVTFTETSN